MSKTFLISDTHFGQSNILTFKRDDGSLLRPFNNIQEHDEYLIDQWNNTVSQKDKVYHLGDIGFKGWTSLANVLSRLNGTKILIKGNHDGHKLSQYQQFFKDIRGSHVLDKFILTHIPIHPNSVSRWKANIHGHLHANTIQEHVPGLVLQDDPRYINVSVEQINYKPIDFEEIRSMFND